MAALAALVLIACWFSAARWHRAVASDLARVWHGVADQSPRLIGALALAAAVLAAVFGTRSASGADASGYVSQAAMWANATALHADSMSAVVVNRDGWLTTPLGWRPAAPGVQVPTYPPGLPLLMAVPHALAGIDGAQAVVMAASAVAVWATGMLAGGAAGVVAAALLAFAPVFLYQSIQPMSDVPVTAAWMLTWLLVLRQGSRIGDQGSGAVRIAAAGVACAVAVLIRPNLAPLAAVPLLAIGMDARRLVAFAVPVATAVLALMWLQWHWYGSPLRSGYGTAGELFALSGIAANAGNYLGWLAATSPALLLSPVGLLVAMRRPHAGARAVQLALFAVMLIASYLAYAVFEHWSYLRFLLPAMAVMAVLTAVAAVAAIDHAPVSWRVAILFVLLLGIMAHGLWQARARDTFRLSDQLRRVSQVAAYINGEVPDAAVLVAGEQSGSLRYYTARPILRWDAAPDDMLAPALASSERAGRLVYIVLDAWEDDLFKRKYWTVPNAQLDWPPVFEAGTSHRTRVWRLSDRDRFRRGEHIQTVRQP